MSNNHEEQIRIVQETVAGKEITFAHVMGGGADRISETWSESTGRLSFFCYRNYEYDAAGICCHRIRYRSKSGNIYLGFADRFTGTLIITGEISDVMSALTEVVTFFRDSLGYVVCDITKR